MRNKVAFSHYKKMRRACQRIVPLSYEIQQSCVMVVAPHMDDETFGCGGALALHKKVNSQVAVVFVSDSSSGLLDSELAAKLSATRQYEATCALGVLGIDHCVELKYPDGDLVDYEIDIAHQLTTLITELEPDQIFCPSPVDGHSDHQACAVALGRALEESDSVAEIMAYEVWSPIWANAIVDISPAIELKKKAISQYQSQLNDRDYMAAVVGLNRYRGLTNKVEFAEAYLRCKPTEFSTLIRLMGRF